MDFRELTYILALAEAQSMTKAAKALYITQPTLSKFLQSLEKTMGQPLFRKVGNQFHLTYAGERYVIKAKEILAIKETLDQEMAEIKRSHARALNVLFPPVRGTYLLSTTLPLFQKTHPNVQIHIAEEPSRTIEELLLTGKADLAFFNTPIQSPDIAYEVLATEEILLVMAKGNPLAKQATKQKNTARPWLDITLAKDERFIVQKPEQRTRQIVDATLKQHDITMQNPLITANIRASAELAAQNFGITFVCETHLNQMHLDDEILCFSCGNPCLTTQFVVAYRKGSVITQDARDYIALVQRLTQDANAAQ